MSTVLAALDSSAAARPVLAVALALGEMTGATVEAVHVAADGAETPAWLAAHSDVPLRVLHGPVDRTLLSAIDDDAVIAAVFGARGTLGGRRPAGHTAMRLLERATKPIVVVPPDAQATAPLPYRQLLVPLEGAAESSRPVIEELLPLIARPGVELVVLHVFTSATVPRALDRPARDLSMWGDEFIARYCPVASRIELRTGPIGARVAEASIDEGVDLVVLSWSRDITPGHAAVIRDVLSASTVPVLLLPVSGEPPR